MPGKVWLELELELIEERAEISDVKTYSPGKKRVPYGCVGVDFLWNSEKFRS